MRPFVRNIFSPFLKNGFWLLVLFFETCEVLVHPSQLFLRLNHFLADCIDPGLPLDGLEVASLHIDLPVHFV